MVRVWVVVLGDFGRSPRMQNHARSLASEKNVTVDVVGTRGAAPPADLKNSANVTIHNIPELPGLILRLPTVLRLVAKTLWQLHSLMWMLLFALPRPNVILLQVPPAIPVLASCVLAAWLRRAKLIVDWHNFGYTIMAITMSSRHPLVLLARHFERFWGRLASAHLCVTRAMQQELKAHWAINATVFYDRPPSSFGPASLSQRHALFTKLQPMVETALHPHDCCAGRYSSASGQGGHGTQQGGEVTVVTTCEGPEASPQLRLDRPAIIVSSTSWTVDEDFGILLEAAQLYDAKFVARRCPRLLLIITGSGPLKDHYLHHMRALDLRHVAFRTAWLAAEDYPLLLGSADLGVSLHTSSSGLDLPMKVVDMFGCGLPVCAVNYSCIHELVEDNKNGLLFSSAAQLADQWLSLFDGWPDHAGPALGRMRHVVEASMAVRWENSWRNVVAPVVAQCGGRAKSIRHLKKQKCT